MFKGTSKVPNDEFSRLSRIYGGTVNAATFTNYTNYYQLYPKTYLPMALELEADRMRNLLLRKQDFDPEIKVVMEERRLRTDDNPRSLAFERFKWISYRPVKKKRGKEEKRGAEYLQICQWIPLYTSLFFFFFPIIFLKKKK